MIDRLALIRSQRCRRIHRTRNRLGRQPNQRPRLSVHISRRHIRAQVIDDSAGRTRVFVSSLKQDGGGCLTARASAVGATVGQRCLAAGIKSVNFDRGGRLYHGRVKALAEAAREAGLQF